MEFCVGASQIYKCDHTLQRVCLAFSSSSVRPSVLLSARLHETTRLPLDGFSWDLISEQFSKFSRENSRAIKIRQKKQVLCTKIFLHLWQYVSEFFLEWDMFWTNVVEKIKRQFMFKNSPPPRKLCHLCDNAGKYDKPGQATDHNTAHARCILHNCSYTHTHTHTHTEYVILIAFPLQQWLYKPDSLLRYTYISRLVYDYACLKTEKSALLKKICHVTP
jgi:hypothetical protein